MRRGEIFWGVMLVVLGGLFFLRTAGLLTGDVFGWFWPLMIIGAGAWVLLGGFGSRHVAGGAADFTVPLQGARQATLTVNHGMGRLQIHGGASDDDFLTGNSGAGLNRSSRLVGDRLEVSLDAGPSVFPFLGPDGGAWSFALNDRVPTELVVHAGATELDIDLADLQVTRLDYEGGASSLRLMLPSGVEHFRSQIKTGASSLDLRVPAAVEARFAITGPASISPDSERFKSIGQGIYQSAGYESASRRADVTIDGGATSIRIA